MSADGPRTPNLFVFVADALRRDFFPAAITDHGTTVDVRADGNKTAVALPSLLGAVAPDQHGCANFGDACDVPTVLDLPDDPAFSDYDAVYSPGWRKQPVHRLLNYPDVGHLADCDPPFVYVEHCWATHAIYGQCRHEDCGHPEFGPDPRTDTHGNAATYESAKAYDLALEQGRVDYYRDYVEGLLAAVETFSHRVGWLDGIGWLDDTVCIFTSDHGEAFPDDGYADCQHQFDCPEVRDVAAVVYGRDLDVTGPIDQRDVLDLWWPGIAGVLGRIDHTRADDLTDDEREALEADLEHLGYV